MPHVDKASNMRFRYPGLSGTVIGVTACNRGCVVSIDITFVTNNGEANTIRIGDLPMALDQINDTQSLASGHMSSLQMLL